MAREAERWRRARQVTLPYPLTPALPLALTSYAHLSVPATLTLTLTLTPTLALPLTLTPALTQPGPQPAARRAAQSEPQLGSRSGWLVITQEAAHGAPHVRSAGGTAAHGGCLLPP